MKRLKIKIPTHIHIAALWVALLITLATSLVALVVVTGVISHQNDALSALICHAEQSTEKQPGIPAAQRRKSIHFFEQQIRLEHLKPCEVPK